MAFSVFQLFTIFCFLQNTIKLQKHMARFWEGENKLSLCFYSFSIITKCGPTLT